MAQSYNTKTRKYILEYLQAKKGKTVTASEIYNYLIGMEKSINLATIYRYLKKLVADNYVIKYVDSKGEKSVYQFIGDANTCSEHLHLKCINCGQLIHLDCTFMNEFDNHIKREHNFNINYEGNILYGMCSNCNDIKK